MTNCHGLKLSKEKDLQQFEEHAQITQQGGKAARKQLESNLGHSVISPLSAKSGLRLEKKKDKNNRWLNRH